MFPLKILPQAFKAMSILIAIISIIIFINFWMTLRPQWVSFDGGDYQWGTVTVNQALNATFQFGVSIISCFVLYGLGQLISANLFIHSEMVEIKARRERRQPALSPRSAMPTTDTTLVPAAKTDTQEREAAETAMLYERARQYQSPPPASPDMSAYRPKRRWSPDADRT